MSHPIHHTFGPLADDRQCRRALAITYVPWKYKHGKSQGLLKKGIEDFFGAPTHLFGSGREALFAALKSLELKADDEVIVQAYTCIVVPNAIVAAGAKPIYADIELDTLNFDLRDLKKRITKHTKAIICQHTFGIPGPLRELRKICDDHGLMLIEDCAHMIPDDTGPSDVGMLGDFVMLSFGRDKAISGVAGGALVVRHPHVQPIVDQLMESATPLPWKMIQRLVHYPLVYRRALPLFGSGLGKLYLHMQKKLGNLVPIVTQKEKNGEMSSVLHEMPNACAYFAVDQWNRRKQINDHRRSITKYYLEKLRGLDVTIPSAIDSSLPLQKLPVFVKNAEGIRKALKKKDIHLHDGWATCVICPPSADAESVSYADGSDPTAEEASQSIVSLPTHPQTRHADALRLIEALKPLLG